MIPKEFDRPIADRVCVYDLKEDGSLQITAGKKPGVYISEFDVGRLFSSEVTKHIRDTYGLTVGVLRDTAYDLKYSQRDTMKMLLGAIVRRPDETSTS